MKEKLKNIVGADDPVRPQKRNTQKGITLIALIISIIVMLILAVVSVNIIMNQGIIDKTQDAANKYNQKAEEEQGELTFFERLLGQYNGEETTESPYVTPRTEVTYKGQTLKVGDYVNYDEGTGYEWTTDITKGTAKRYDGKTLISGTNTTEDMGWRVLGLDANGNLELISDKQTSESLWLTGKAGYYNGEEQLNEMCDTLYGKGTKAKSARSVNTEDINAILGYNKKGFKVDDIGSGVEIHLRYGWKTTYYATRVTWEPKDIFKIEGKNEGNYDGDGTFFTNIDGTEATDENPITIESNVYRYERDEFVDKVDSNILNMVFGENSNNYFWLASSCVDAGFGESGWGLFFILYDWLEYNHLYTSDGAESYLDGHFVRPVVTLKSDVQLSGNSETGWTIN